jgi:hypothetical protein
MLGYRGGGQGRGGVGRGRGPVVCHNYQKQGTMQENVHYHLRHACIVVQQITIQRIAQHCWGRYRKNIIKIIRMYSGSLQNLEKMEGTST